MREVTIVDGKRITVTTTVDVDDAEIPWSDVLDAVEVVADYDHTEAPWDDCDGWEHNAQRLRYGPDHADMKNSDRYVIADRDGAYWLTLDVEKSGIPDANYYRTQGASKQVSAELAAQALRNAYAQLHKWYSDGWQYYGVKGELKDCHASVRGIDNEDYARREVVGEIASELASELESAGYVVTDRPQPEHQKHSDAYNAYANNRWRHSVDRFNVSPR